MKCYRRRGGQLGGRHYAYRRDRGAEMHLTELMDFAQRSLNRGKHAYPASFDVAGAFENAPRRHVMEVLEADGADSYIRRKIHKSIKDRTR